MSYKMVVRLMDSFGTLLGWAEAEGHARGDGKIWIERPVTVAITTEGAWDYTSVHWADVNVEVKCPVPEGPLMVPKGAVIPLAAPWPAITVGPAAGGLPPVVVGHNVSITVPTGSLVAVGN